MNILVQIRFCLFDLPRCVLQFLVRSIFRWFDSWFFCLSLACSAFFCDIRLFDFSLLAGLCFSVGASCDFVASKFCRSFDFLPPEDPF